MYKSIRSFSKKNFKNFFRFLLTPPEEREEFVAEHCGKALHRSTIITCMTTVNNKLKDDSSDQYLVIGTESRHIFIVDALSNMTKAQVRSMLNFSHLSIRYFSWNKKDGILYCCTAWSTRRTGHHCDAWHFSRAISPLHFLSRWEDLHHNERVRDVFFPKFYHVFFWETQCEFSKNDQEKTYESINQSINQTILVVHTWSINQSIMSFTKKIIKFFSVPIFVGFFL